jgi:hypothetical protein
VADQLEVLVIEQRLYIPPRAGEEIVETDDLRAFSDQTRTEMGTEEACAAGNQNTLFQVHSKYFAVRGRCWTLVCAPCNITPLEKSTIR